jgi:hypothetical protein
MNKFLNQLNICTDLCEKINLKLIKNDSDYFLIPYIYLSEDSENHPRKRYEKFLEKIRPNLEINKLINGNYLSEFLKENIDLSDYSYIYPYKIPIRIYSNINIFPFEEIGIFDVQGNDKDDFDKYYF